MIHHIQCHVSRRLPLALSALALLFFFAGVLPSWSLLSSDYQFTATTGTYTPLTGGTQLIAGTDASTNGTFNDSAVGGPVDIGFTVQFDCLAYTKFSVSANGTIYFGNSTSNSYNNDLSAAPLYPVIAPWWDHQHLYDGGGAGAACNFSPPIGIYYALSGTSPNRVLTIEFNTQVADASNAFWWAGCGLTMNRYQVRIYENDYSIEFHYGNLWASSGQATAATIGIGNGTSNFLSLTPTGGTATVSSVTSNNTIQQHVALIPAGTIFRFKPCYMRLFGNPGYAKPAPVPGDSLMLCAGGGTHNVFSITYPPGACPNHNYTLTISGSSASEYAWLATGNQTQAGTVSAGSTLNPSIVFTPSTIGVRPAFLTFTDNTIGCSIIYTLVGGAVASEGVVIVDQPILWPPNHSMHTINTVVNVSGPCAGVPFLQSITSNEGDAGLDPGDIAVDVQNATTGTLDISFDLRAERGDNGKGRIYTITYGIPTPSGTEYVNGKVVVPANLGEASAFASGCGITFGANVPEPFTISTTIPFTLALGTDVTVNIYNSMGKNIRTLVNNVAYSAGAHNVVWDRLDRSGLSVPNGTYYIQIVSPCGTSAPLIVTAI